MKLEGKSVKEIIAAFKEGKISKRDLLQLSDEMLAKVMNAADRGTSSRAPQSPDELLQELVAEGSDRSKALLETFKALAKQLRPYVEEGTVFVFRQDARGPVDCRIHAIARRVQKDGKAVTERLPHYGSTKDGEFTPADVIKL